MTAATGWNDWPEQNLYRVDEGHEWKGAARGGARSGRWSPWHRNHIRLASLAPLTLPPSPPPVYPFCYTFPSGDPTKRQWVDRNCMQCPRTVELLRSIPAVRTALYSRMSPGTHLTPHQVRPPAPASQPQSATGACVASSPHAPSLPLFPTASQGWAELANSVLRAHIALAVPEPDVSGVAVEGEERVHSQGDILMFDDSKVHLGFNRGATHRCVLIVDVERPPDVPLGRAGGGRTEALEAFISYFAHGGDAAALQQAMDRSLADAHWMHGDDSSSEGSGGEDGGESDAARTDTA